MNFPMRIMPSVYMDAMENYKKYDRRESEVPCTCIQSRSIEKGRFRAGPFCNDLLYRGCYFYRIQM